MVKTTNCPIKNTPSTVLAVSRPFTRHSRAAATATATSVPASSSVAYSSIVTSVTYSSIAAASVARPASSMLEKAERGKSEAENVLKYFEDSRKCDEQILSSAFDIEFFTVINTDATLNDTSLKNFYKCLTK
jgi:hypothetical protein